MSKVWDSEKVFGMDKFVLLAIADNAWDDGTNSWPSVTTIMKKCGIARSTVQRCMRNLEALGLLDTTQRFGTSNMYRVIDDEAVIVKAKAGSAVVKKAKKSSTELVVRNADDVWDAVMNACGINVDTLNTQERGKHNKAVKLLKESGATAQQITERAQEYKRRFEKAALTPLALASHWSSLEFSQQASNQVPGGWSAIEQAREQRGA
jgi:DNA-binding transcriptional regulator YhcF (GntR family)